MKMKRKLGKSGIEVSAVGPGCWPIGGAWKDNTFPGGKVVSMGKINDGESLKAINKALDLGINFFDTAEGYGGGHSESIPGKGIKGKRDSVVIATKIAEAMDYGPLTEEQVSEIDNLINRVPVK